MTALATRPHLQAPVDALQHADVMDVFFCAETQRVAYRPREASLTAEVEEIADSRPFAVEVWAAGSAAPDGFVQFDTVVNLSEAKRTLPPGLLAAAKPYMRASADYGVLWWNPETKTAVLNMGDGDDTKGIEAKLGKVPGVEKVEVADEIGTPSTSGTWMRTTLGLNGPKFGIIKVRGKKPAPKEEPEDEPVKVKDLNMTEYTIHTGRINLPGGLIDFTGDLSRTNSACDYPNLSETMTSAQISGYSDHTLGMPLTGTCSVCGDSLRDGMTCENCRNNADNIRRGEAFKMEWVLSDTDQSLDEWLYTHYLDILEGGSVEINIQDVQDYFDFCVSQGDNHPVAKRKTKTKFKLKDLEVNPMGRVASKDVDDVKPDDPNSPAPPAPAEPPGGGGGEDGEEEEPPDDDAPPKDGEQDGAGKGKPPEPPTGDE